MSLYKCHLNLHANEVPCSIAPFEKKGRGAEYVAGHINISDFGLKARAFQVCFLSHVRCVGEPDSAAARGAQQPPSQQLGPGCRVTVNK